MVYRTIVKPVAARLTALVAAVVLVSAGTLVALSSPAAAAPPLYVRNAAGGCLDQHYAGGVASIDVYVASCHWGVNQIWRMEPRTANTFTMVNALSDMCLSAPNDPTRNPLVYAEDCTGAQKQVWGASTTAMGYNLLVSQQWANYCLTYRTDTNHATLARCEPGAVRGNWYWF